MEEIFSRFPGLGDRIFHHLDEKNLAKCRKINYTWKTSIDNEKTIWIRMIQKHVDNFNTSLDWKLSLSRTSKNTIKELAIGKQDYQLNA